MHDIFQSKGNLGVLAATENGSPLKALSNYVDIKLLFTLDIRRQRDTVYVHCAEKSFMKILILVPTKVRSLLTVAPVGEDSVLKQISINIRDPDRKPESCFHCGKNLFQNSQVFIVCRLTLFQGMKTQRHSKDEF